MKILAVDTSCSVATVAVADEKSLLGEYTTNIGRTHSQQLLPMIDALLKMISMDIEDIDLFCSVSGPGSFTGLRIGVTTIKGFAYALNKPVVVVSSLDVLAAQIPQFNTLICPIMDARNNQVYTSLYKWDKNHLVMLTDYMAVHVDELATIISGEIGDDLESKNIVFTGDAVKIQKEYLLDKFGDRVIFTDDVLFHNRAAAAAKLGLNKYVLGQCQNSFDITPFYLRKSQAERMKGK